MFAKWKVIKIKSGEERKEEKQRRVNSGSNNHPKLKQKGITIFPKFYGLLTQKLGKRDKAGGKEEGRG